ncbi:MAG: hypothetical protein LBS31_09025, partial [Candidatus Adiutrix sp.]|nr:hypothetical protein [Candidatus Adiutrix sp.]
MTTRRHEIVKMFRFLLIMAIAATVGGCSRGWPPRRDHDPNHYYKYNYYDYYREAGRYYRHGRPAAEFDRPHRPVPPSPPAVTKPPRLEENKWTTPFRPGYNHGQAAPAARPGQTWNRPDNKLTKPRPEVRPVKPPEVRPAKPPEVRPAKPPEVRPAKPPQVRPAKPPAVTPSNTPEAT